MSDSFRDDNLNLVEQVLALDYKGGKMNYLENHTESKRSRAFISVFSYESLTLPNNLCPWPFSVIKTSQYTTNKPNGPFH